MIKKKTIIIANIYMPPDSSPWEMKDILDKLTNCPQIKDLTKELIITGDFNLPYCTWNMHGTMETGANSTKGKLLDNLMELLLLTQL